MRLDQVMPGAPAGATDIEVTDLTYDNRQVTPGTLFFCVLGFTRDGHEFAPEAIARGAVALVVQRALGLGVPEIAVPDVRAAMPRAAAAFYGHPTAELQTVGVTGTNGKTTTAFLVRALLEAAVPRQAFWGRSRASSAAPSTRFSAPRLKRSTCKRPFERCSTLGIRPA